MYEWWSKHPSASPYVFVIFVSSRRRHTRYWRDWSSDVCSSDLTALQFAPTLLFSFYGGVLADRYDKRRVLVATQAVMGALALGLGLLVATGAVDLWHVYALAAALGVASSLDMPVRQSFVSEMVGPERLANAVSLNSTVFNGARLVGPAVGGRRIGPPGGGTAPPPPHKAPPLAPPI